MATETYELRIQAADVASYRENVLHFSGVGVATNDTLAAAESLCTAFDGTWKSLWLATLPAQYYLVTIAARRVSPKPSAVGYITYGVGSTVGTRGSNAVAQQTCPSIFLVPTMGTKSGGKVFWPCIPAGDISSGAYSAGWKTAVDAFFTSTVAGVTVGGITWTQVIYSRKHNTSSVITGHSYSPVIGFIGKRRKPAGVV